MKPSERYDLIAKLKNFALEVNGSHISLGKAMGIKAENIGNYLNDVNMPYGENCRILKAFFDKPVEEQKELYQQSTFPANSLFNKNSTDLLKRIEAIESEIMSITIALKEVIFMLKLQKILPCLPGELAVSEVNKEQDAG